MLNRKITMINAAILVMGAFGLGALGPALDPTPQESRTKVQTQPQLGEIVVLSAIDELSSAFDFDSGRHVTRFENDQIDLDSAEIAFELIQPSGERDTISYGFVERREIALIDLGDVQAESRPRSTDLSPKPTVSAFYSLFRRGAALYYRKPDDKVQRVHQADDIFDSLPNAVPKSFEPQLGHLYVMRYAPRGTQAKSERLVMFRVIGHVPGQSVTLRWAPIPTEKL